MNKKLIIACYFFPPCPSIGGRRAAKFAKYLAASGVEVHVVQAVNCFPNVSTWLKDVEGKKGIVRHELPLNYPVEFIIPPKGIAGKMKYRFYNLFFNLFHSKKNKYDYTIFWEKSYISEVKRLVRELGIKNIMVSGPPFYYAYQTVKLKEEFPDLNMIIDFRDPWIGSPYYGMSALKKQQEHYEISLLSEVYEKADYFTAPNSFLLNEQLSYINSKSGAGAKIVELAHGYDLEEVKHHLEVIPRSEDGKIRFVYGGQLYPGTEGILTAIAKTLNAIKMKNPPLYSKLEFNFFTPEVYRQHFFEEHRDVVTFSEPIGNKIMDKISESTFCLIFLADHNKDYRTTKFLEYAILRKPFLVFGNKGYVARFVEENQLGRAFDTESMSAFEIFLSEIKFESGLHFNRQYDFSEHEYGKISNQLKDLLV